MSTGPWLLQVFQQGSFLLAVIASFEVPLPGPPADVRAQATPDGVLVSWRAAPEDAAKRGAPLAFDVFRRRTPESAPERVSAKPVLLSEPPAEGQPGSATYRDANPPTEVAVWYSVAGVDDSGRRGPESAPVEVFVPDFTANAPPATVLVLPGPGRVTVSWEPRPNPNTQGFRVERSDDLLGPYYPLASLPPFANSFTDTTGHPNSTYYYRVVALNRRNEMGPPSRSAKAFFSAARLPGAPAGLSAERQVDLVRLKWTEGDAPTLQGYRVERDSGDGRWTLLTAFPTIEARFDDRLPPKLLGALGYRVVAVGLDGKVSPPSAVLRVPAAKVRAPARPEITSIGGFGGMVTVEFRAGGGRGETAGFLVLRSASARDPGVVIVAAPLPKESTSFTDTGVLAGTEYVYRVVAVDEAGNRSDPSAYARVRVGAR